MSTSGGAAAATPDAFPAGAQGYGAWSGDPAGYSATGAGATIGVASYCALWVPAPMTVHTITSFVVNAGVALSNCYMGLYSATAQLAVTADISANLLSNGAPSANAVVTPVAIPAGVVYVAYLTGNGSTTAPLFYRTTPASGAWININLTPAAGSLTLRASTLGAALTALPGAIAGTPAVATTSQWFALS